MTQSAPFRIGSSRDAVNASTLEMLDLLTASSNVESCWSTLIDAMSLFGFDRLFYGHTRQYTEKSLGPKDDILVLSNHSVDYINGFIGTNRYLDAPLMSWARKNVGAISWSWVNENRHSLNERQLEVLDFNHSTT